MKARHEFPTDEQYKDYLKHYYVGQAMQGILAASYDLQGLDQNEADAVTRDAIMFADQLLTQLSK